MSTDPIYEVYETEGSEAHYVADCFTHAERRARWYAARHNRRYSIERVTPPAKWTRTARYQRELVATVIRDALGRIWTDVQDTDGLI